MTVTLYCACLTYAVWPETLLAPDSEGSLVASSNSMSVNAAEKEAAMQEARRWRQDAQTAEEKVRACTTVPSLSVTIVAQVSRLSRKVASLEVEAASSKKIVEPREAQQQKLTQVGGVQSGSQNIILILPRSSECCICESPGTASAGEGQRTAAAETGQKRRVGLGDSRAAEHRAGCGSAVALKEE